MSNTLEAALPSARLAKKGPKPGAKKVKTRGPRTNYRQALEPIFVSTILKPLVDETVAQGLPTYASMAAYLSARIEEITSNKCIINMTGMKEALKLCGYTARLGLSIHAKDSPTPKSSKPWFEVKRPAVLPPTGVVDQILSEEGFNTAPITHHEQAGAAILPDRFGGDDDQIMRMLAQGVRGGH